MTLILPDNFQRRVQKSRYEPGHETFFDSSYKNVVSFIPKEDKISVHELREILVLIEKREE